MFENVKYIRPSSFIRDPKKANALCDQIMNAPKVDTTQLDNMVDSLNKKVNAALADGSYYFNKA